MQHVISSIKRIVLISFAGVLFAAPVSFPLLVAAEDCVTAAAPSGLDRPVGADAGTYTYNSCGYWENTYYTWSPATHSATAKTTPTYTYNQSTGQWDAMIWHWSPASGSFYQSPVSVDEPPAGAPRVGGPVATPAAPSGGDSSTSNSTADTSSTSEPAGGSPTTTSTNDQTATDTNNATLNNTVTSTAKSGNAMVLSNVNAGDATSGNAQAIANIFNLLQSSSSMGANVATFVANVDGDVQGDLIIDPSALQPATASSALNNNVDVNVANNGSIANIINLTAQSGDATVSKNVSAGDATSGNAQAIANVVNMMNTLVSANQSFLGVVNINGNLNGNILMPQNFLDSLIASNAPHETIAVPQDAISNLSAQVSNNQNITNNVTSTATSGAALAELNTNSGPASSASSGTATTNVTIFNLASNQISGGNAMLVFVNVLGTWVGVIMDAPAGSTAAALGGGVTTSNMGNNDVNYDVSNTGTITNDINVAAMSGKATLTKNVDAGNAKSGNASTAVNIANLTNNTVNLAGWFGILFINVFGNWNGNFGVLKPSVAGTLASSTGTAGGGMGAASSSPARMFAFVPHKTTSAKPHSNGFLQSSGPQGGSGVTTASGDASDFDVVAAKVLGSHVATTPGLTATQLHASVKKDHNQTVMVGVVLFSGGLLLMAIEQIRTRRNQ